MWPICRGAPWRSGRPQRDPDASSAMVVFALEDVYAGDTVELDEQQ